MVISNPSWTGLTSFTAHLYHFGRRWSSHFSYFQSKVDSYWLMWCVKLDGLICWHSLKWTVKGDSWVCYMINEPNWTIKSERFDFLGEPSSKKQKLMITWLLTVRKNAFDPLSNCSNWTKSVFWIVWSHVIVNLEEKVVWTKNHKITRVMWVRLYFRFFAVKSLLIRLTCMIRSI